MYSLSCTSFTHCDKTEGLDRMVKEKAAMRVEKAFKINVSKILGFKRFEYDRGEQSIYLEKDHRGNDRCVYFGFYDRKNDDQKEESGVKNVKECEIFHGRIFIRKSICKRKQKRF